MASQIPAATPLGPDDGDQGRLLRSMTIAAQVRIEKSRLGYKVPSQTVNGTYLASIDENDPYCTCPDFAKRKASGKHIYAAKFTAMRENLPTGCAVERDVSEESRTFQSSRSRDWPYYNSAQVEEQARFGRLLSKLCDVTEEPPQRAGRPSSLVEPRFRRLPQSLPRQVWAANDDGIQERLRCQPVEPLPILRVFQQSHYRSVRALVFGLRRRSVADFAFGGFCYFGGNVWRPTHLSC